MLIAGAMAALWWLRRPEPVRVVVVQVDRGRVEASVSNTRAGTIEACQRTKLSTIIGGRIDVLAVREGDRVQPGQLLLRLWNDDLQAQVALARAQLDTAGKRASEACTLARSAAREAQRQSELAEQSFISASRLEAARAEADSRQASCAAAEAGVGQANASLRLAQAQLQRTELRAPFAGVVARINGEVGEFTTPSPPGVPTPPAIDLIDTSCLYVVAPMDEVDAPRVQPGQAARISLDAMPGRVFAGKVRRIAPYVDAIEKQARTVDVEADFDDPGGAGRLLVGYSADIEVILEVRDEVLRVPTAALREGRRVLLLGADGRLEERTVRAGVSNWEYTEVTEGVAAGERVVTSLEREGVTAGAIATADDR
ncbi:MAG: efflux RND transporter periplasmic adaptor subunit [Burkholderiales bacterium]|nr:MAG: efflux RND transporter periplasmic adaptor subunit [Burkholderiales bacterium]